MGGRKKKDVGVVQTAPLSEEQREHLFRQKEAARRELQKILSDGVKEIEKSISALESAAEAFADEHGLAFSMPKIGEDSNGREYVSAEALRINVSDHGGSWDADRAPGWAWMNSWC